MSIPAFVLFCTGLTGILCAGLPIAAAVWLRRRRQAETSSFFWGCLFYVLFVLILQRTCQQLVGLETQPLWFVVVYNGLAAAVFCELGRLAAFGWVRKEQRTLPDALLCGVGFGWCDAFLLTGLEMLYTTALGLAINRDPALFAADANAEVYRTLAAQLQGTAPLDVLAGCVNQLLVTALQAALSVLVMTAAARGRKGWFAAAFGLHAAFGCLSALCAQLEVSPVLQVLVPLALLAAGVLLARRAAQTAWADIGPSGTQAAAPAAKAARVEVWNDRLPRRPQ